MSSRENVVESLDDGSTAGSDSTIESITTESERNRRTRERVARQTDAGPSDLRVSNDGSVELSDQERRQRAAEGTPYAPGELRVAEDGSVQVRERARREQVASETPYDPDELSVADDGSVVVTDPAPEKVTVSVYDESGPSGEVAWVGPDGQRIETGEQAGATAEEPYFARVDTPETQGRWRLQVGGETVERVDIGPVATRRDVSSAALGYGWNGAVIELNEQDGTATARQSPSAYQRPASADPDVVAGAGAADALQAGSTPEQLSPINPITPAQADQIESAIADAEQTRQRVQARREARETRQERFEDMNPALRGNELNRRLRERIADDVDGLTADQVDVVQTPDGLAYQRDGARIGDDDELDFGGRAEDQPAPTRTRSLDEALSERDGTVTTRETPAVTRGDVRAAVTQYGQRQLDRQRPSGQTFVDQQLEAAERRTGVDVIPGEGDLVQDIERELIRMRDAQRTGQPGSILPSPDQAERFARQAAATTLVGDRATQFRVGDQTYTNREATGALAAGTARRAAQAANVPGAILGTGRLVEGTGEFVYNSAIGGLDGPRQQPGAPVAVAGVDQTTVDAAESETAQTAGEVAAAADRLANETRTAASQRPIQTAGSAAFEAGALVASVGAPIAAERGARAAQSAIRARRYATVDFDDISDPATRGQAVGSPNPEFSQAALRDTDVAVREFRSQARQTPEVVADRADGGTVVYHGTDEQFPETTTVDAGSSELEGLFVAADASPLRLSRANAGGLSSVRPRLPRFRDQRQIVATSPRSIGNVPDRLGAGRTPGADLDRPIRGADGEIIDREQGAVSQYLDEQAQSGSAQILPGTTRTPEQEALIPRGTSLEDTGRRVGVRIEGDVIPARFYEPVGEAGGRATGEVSDAAEVARRSDELISRVERRQGTPVNPLAPLGSPGVRSAPSAVTGQFESPGVSASGTRQVSDVNRQSPSPGVTSQGPLSSLGVSAGRRPGATSGGASGVSDLSISSIGTSASVTGGTPTGGVPTSGTPTRDDPTIDTPTYESPTYDFPTYDTPTYGTPTEGPPTTPTPPGPPIPPPTMPPPEPPDQPEDDDNRFVDDTDQSAIRRPREPGEDAIGVGWLQQTLVTIAQRGRGQGGLAPSERRLDATDPSLAAIGEFPTLAQLDASGDFAAALDDAGALFGFGGGR